jgi:hypothetical protein
MIRKILLSAKSPKGTYTLQGSYYDKVSRKHLYVVENGKRVISDFENDGSYKQFDVLLSDGAMYTLEYDDNSKDELAVVDFYINHPLVYCVGHTNPNSISPLFTLVLQHKVIDNEIEAMNENLDIALKCLSLSFEEKHDLAFALGIDARGMTHRELISRLIGANLAGDAITRKNVFEHYYDSIDTDRKVKVYVNKAISLGIIKQENGYFRVGGRTLGSQERDVVDMCNSDKDFFYGFIVPECDKHIVDPSEDLNDFDSKDVTNIINDKLKSVREKRARKKELVDKLVP